jgi:hypothetical protein
MLYSHCSSLSISCTESYGVSLAYNGAEDLVQAVYPVTACQVHRLGQVELFSNMIPRIGTLHVPQAPFAEARDVVEFVSWQASTNIDP